MIKNAKPRAFNIVHFKEEIGVIAPVIIGAHIIPDRFLSLGRKPSDFHAKSNPRTSPAKIGMDRKNPPPATAATFFLNLFNSLCHKKNGRAYPGPSRRL